MGRTRLIFKGITEIVGTETLGLIVLTDFAEKSQITIVCDQHTEFQFGLRVGKVSMVNKFLPEVLLRVIREQTSVNLELVINNVVNDQYNALLCNTDTFDMIPMRASDAAFLSFVGGIPLYMDDELMRLQSVPYHADASGMSIPVNVISDKMLDSALAKAIKEENYELASRLRDELQRRKENTHP